MCLFVSAESVLFQLWQFGRRQKGKYLLSCFLWRVFLHPSGLPSPSATCWRVDRLPITACFLPATAAGQLVGVSGERSCCRKFSYLSVALKEWAPLSTAPSPAGLSIHVSCSQTQAQMLPRHTHPLTHTPYHLSAVRQAGWKADTYWWSSVIYLGLAQRFTHKHLAPGEMWPQCSHWLSQNLTSAHKSSKCFTFFLFSISRTKKEKKTASLWIQQLFCPT